MKTIIHPSNPSGAVDAPPSKSYAHRALICSALSGASVVKNLAFSNDITATLNCLKALGANADVCGTTASLGGIDIKNPKNETELFCDESGSTLRFLIPLCLVTDKKITLTGSTRLFERPLEIYESICKEQGLLFSKTANSLTLQGGLKNGNFRVKGNISSQFITGLLFALPLLEGISIIEIEGEFESASYVDLTLSVLSSFGIKIVRAGNRFIVYGGQKYKNAEYTVEGDCSNAAFLEAFNALGGDVKVGSIPETTLQGDRVYKQIFNDIEKGIKEFNLSDCPDLAPILFAVAAAKGGCLFTGTKRLKIKESDRASAMAEELGKFGIPVEVGENHVRIANAPLSVPKFALNGHNDHRIVMALSVLATLTGGEINGSEAVSKSYPDFFDVIKTLNVKVEQYDT